VLTTRDVCRILGLSQQRVSQLHRSGALIAIPDREGRLRFDRESVERYSHDAADLRERRSDVAARRRAEREEARHRAKREQARAAREREERQRYEDDLRERMVSALESIARSVQK